MAIRRWAVMWIAAVCLASDGARTIASAQVAQGDESAQVVQGDGSAQVAQGDGTTPQEPAKPETIPVPEHTGWGSLFHSTMSDFAAFPRRKSTWVILGIGAGAAAIAYPFDDEINESLQDADALDKFLTPGKYLGYAWVQGGAAVGRRHPHQQGGASRLRSPSRQPRDAGTHLRDQGLGPTRPPDRRMLFVSLRPRIDDLRDGRSPRAAFWLSRQLADVRDRGLRLSEPPHR